MFPGNNTFVLNPATMMQAVQEYLDKRFVLPPTDSPSIAEKPKVTSIIPSTIAGGWEYSVKTEAPYEGQAK